MFKTFKETFGAGLGTIAGLFAGTLLVEFVTSLLPSKKTEVEADPDIETEE